jgi:alpha-L-fucosidase
VLVPGTELVLAPRGQPKSARQVLDHLAAVNKRNSNFLLNVGPNQQGRFDAASVKVLAEVGTQLKRKEQP